MFLAIFEVRPKTERFDDYLALAKRLKPTLEKIDGFVENERFESRRRPAWILSLSTWRDEKSMVRWRTTGVHHVIQKQGRAEIFEDYHLRIGDVTADTDAPSSAPVHEERFDETEIGAKLATVTELTPQEGASFDSQTISSRILASTCPAR
jgi:heme-degrading monooxygenase HmoA